MKRKLQTELFTASYGKAFIDYQRFIRANPYIEIVSVIADDVSVLVTYYE